MVDFSKKLAKNVLPRLAAKATHYGVLDVSPGELTGKPIEVEAALTVARRNVMRCAHPDRVVNAPELAQLAHDVASRANVAFDILSDVRKRKVYDMTLLKTHAKCGRCSGNGVFRKQKGFGSVVFTECEACDGEGWAKKL